MKATLIKLVERHGTFNVDWMGFQLNKKNKLTYHHIIKKCDKGKKTVDNGAVLGRKAHRFLHFVEVQNHLLYDEWNDLFKEINESNEVPDEDIQNKIKVLRKKGDQIEKIYMQRK